MFSFRRSSYPKSQQQSSAVSTCATSGSIADFRRQETVLRAPRMRHKPLPPMPPDDESQQSWSDPGAGISADSISSSSAASASVADVGTQITWISPTSTEDDNFCDIFTGIHSSVGEVALKRPRIETTGYKGDPFGVCELSIIIVSSADILTPTKEVPTRSCSLGEAATSPHSGVPRHFPERWTFLFRKPMH